VIYFATNYKPHLIKLLLNSQELYQALVVYTSVSFALMLVLSVRQLIRSEDACAESIKIDLNNNKVELKNKGE